MDWQIQKLDETAAVTLAALNKTLKKISKGVETIPRNNFLYMLKVNNKDEILVKQSGEYNQWNLAMFVWTNSVKTVIQ